MHHIDGEFYIYFFLAMAALLLISIIIPLYGFISKRWKGLALGCLIQPFALVLAYLLMTAGAYFYDDYSKDKCREDAMVTVRETIVEDTDTIRHTWYLKPDEECLYECRRATLKKDSDSISHFSTEFYDVVKLDSTSVGVEDRLVVAFDLKAQTVTATDNDNPVEILSIKWDKVKAYFCSHGTNADE